MENREAGVKGVAADCNAEKDKQSELVQSGWNLKENHAEKDSFISLFSQSCSPQQMMFSEFVLTSQIRMQWQAFPANISLSITFVMQSRVCWCSSPFPSLQPVENSK